MITILPEKSSYPVKFLQAKFPGKKIIATDFIITEALNHDSRLKPEYFGYRYKNIYNIDHHAPSKRMAKIITSTDLALKFIRRQKQLNPKDWRIVIHHFDTDSILSSAVLSGILPPLKIFSQAALDSDHLGAVNLIADLLDAIKDKRDLKYSLKNLELLLTNKPLPKEVKKELLKIKQDRLLATKAVKNGLFKNIGSVYYAPFKHKISSSYFVPLIPKAKAILISMPHPKNPKKLEIKMRLGLSGYGKIMLNRIKFNKREDFNWSGRWNAGSNRRRNGTDKSLEQCAEIISKKIINYR